MMPALLAATLFAVADWPGEEGGIAVPVTAAASGTLTAAVEGLEESRGLPRDAVEIRLTRRALEPFERLPLARGERAELVVRYRLPPDLHPAAYRGRLRLRLGDRPALAVALEITVRPYRLPPAQADFYMYAESPPDPGTLRRELEDQRRHGMTMGFVPDPVSREGDLDRPRLEAYLDAYRAAGFPRGRVRMDLWNRITSEWLNEPDKSIGMWGPWFRYYAFSERLDRRYAETVLFVRDACAKRGLDLVLGVADEPGSHAWTIPAAKHYLDLVRRAAPGVLLDLTVGGGWASGEREEEHWRGRLDSWTTNRWLPEKLDVVRRENPAAAVNLYNMGGAGSGPGGATAARMVFGFFAWKARAGGVAQWVYHHAATPEHNYVWPAAEEHAPPLPTPRWEAVREGTKDYRLLALVERKLARASGPTAVEARAVLAELAAKIELRNEDYDAISGGRVPAPPREELDRWRDRLAALVERL